MYNFGKIWKDKKIINEAQQIGLASGPVLAPPQGRERVGFAAETPETPSPVQPVARNFQELADQVQDKVSLSSKNGQYVDIQAKQISEGHIPELDLKQISEGVLPPGQIEAINIVCIMNALKMVAQNKSHSTYSEEEPVSEYNNGQRKMLYYVSGENIGKSASGNIIIGSTKRGPLGNRLYSEIVIVPITPKERKAANILCEAIDKEIITMKKMKMAPLNFYKTSDKLSDY